MLSLSQQVSSNMLSLSIYGLGVLVFIGFRDSGFRSKGLSVQGSEPSLEAYKGPRVRTRSP